MSPFEQALCREALVFLCLSGLTLIALDPHDFLEHISVFEAVFVWACADVIFALVYFVTLLGIAMIPTRRPLKIYLPIPSTFAFTLTTVFVESLIGALSLGEYTPKVWPDVVAFVVVAQLFEFLFVRYVLPDVLADIRAQTPEAPDSAFLKIGESKWPLSDVAAISSNQHYLKVDFLNAESETIRARISDVLDTLPETAGIQPHRSWWVSIEARPSLITEGRKRWLVTDFGHKIPVARGRIDAVEKWLDTHQSNESPSPS